MNASKALQKLGLAGISVLAGLQAAYAGDVTFWTWRQEDRSQYQEIFKEFEAKNPGVKIKFEAIEPQNYPTALSAALAGGRGPDVIHVRAYGGLEQFAKAGYLLPLDQTIVPGLSNFSTAALASATLRADGKVYSVPFASQTFGMYVNQEIFDRYGLKAPKTWDEFKTVCSKLKENNIFALANGTAYPVMVEGLTGAVTAGVLGQEFVDDILAGRATFQDPRYITALSQILDIRDCMPTGFTGIDYPTMQQLFLSGRAAMFIGGSYEISNFRRQNPKLQMAFVAPPAPAGKSQVVPMFFDGGYSVNSKSANKDDALKLVRYMATPEFGNRFTELLSNISPIKGVEIKDPLLAQVAKLNETSVPYLMLVHFRYNEPTGSSLLQGAIQRMMSGTATPQQVGEELTKGIATYYAPFQKK